MRRLNNSEKSGFTILELAIAMLFISFLLLAIGFVSVQLAVIYEKGITIKVVNNNGRELIDEFSRTNFLSRYDQTLDYKYTFTQNRDNINIRNDESNRQNVQLHGAFCTGAYSYVWNTGYALNLDDSPENENKKAILKMGDETKTKFRLARVNDSRRAVCANKTKDDATLSGNEYDAGDQASNYVELLSASENDLVFYEFIMYRPAVYEAAGHALFAGSFLLGTMKGDIDITTTGNFCEVSRPDSFASDFSYCAINKFNFAARATGGLSI